MAQTTKKQRRRIERPNDQLRMITCVRLGDTNHYAAMFARTVVAWDLDTPLRIYYRESALPRSTFLSYLFLLKNYQEMIIMDVIDKRKSATTETRWNPQPALAFHRKGHGYVLVVGNNVLLTSDDLKPNAKIIRTTHLQALEEACLLTGAQIASGRLVSAVDKELELEEEIDEEIVN
jgi:hypothetical protein